MKNKKQLELILNGTALFARIFMKYDVLEKKPINVGNGIEMSASHIHMIEAIGKGYGQTVTELSNHFMITKGAVSQVLSSLKNDRYIRKSKKQDNEKKVILELTKKGLNAFECHEKYNQLVLSEFVEFQKKYTESELQTFLNILNDVDSFFGRVIAKESEN
jgi:DNA-binding MarR family transcriptional regulator